MAMLWLKTRGVCGIRPQNQQAELLRAAADPMDAAFRRRSETRVAESAAYGQLQTRKIEAMDTCRRIGFHLTGRFPFSKSAITVAWHGSCGSPHRWTNPRQRRGCGRDFAEPDTGNGNSHGAPASLLRRLASGPVLGQSAARTPWRFLTK
jgi:hypothetical protein